MSTETQGTDGSLPLLDGKTCLDPFVMKRLLYGRGWTITSFCNDNKLEKRTAKKVFGKGRVQMSTAKTVAEVFGVEMLEIIDPSEYTPPALSSEAKAELGTGEWSIGKTLTPVITTANGLQYRVFTMNHVYDSNRRGRGKRYEFYERSDEDKERTRHALSRHFSVCEMLAPSSYFPTCYSTFPDRDRDTWWVIDQWIDGQSLAERLERGRLDAADVYSVGKQLAEAIVEAHDTDVIIREMTPHSILLKEKSSDIVLTDFELAKLTEDYPTVSAGGWPKSPYRAPEVGAGKIDRSVDIYAWGRIMSHATLGRLPVRGQEPRELKFSMAPKGWIELLVACTQPQRSMRSIQTADIVETICCLQGSS